ncbi:MAG TPA: glycosyltransferase family 87 protein, partial [Pirellulales bacterium]|nr:glycosyltransferase family 87 protein [Pirellulales bacterium]
QSEWQTCYVRAGERMLAGEVIHRLEPSAYAYPPLMAMCAVPFSCLSPRWSLAVWYAINGAAMLVVLHSAWRLAGSPALSGSHGRPAALFGLAALLSFRFLAAPLENQQFDVVIAALLLVGCRRLSHGRELSAALWLGAAAAMKCTPLLFAPYLAWRGRIQAACLLVLVAVALNRLPDYVFRQGRGVVERRHDIAQPLGGTYLGDWMATFLSKVGRDAPGAWESDLLLNQSLSGLVNRLVQAGFPLSTAHLPSAQAELAPASVRAIRLLVYGLSLVLVGATAFRLGPPGRLPRTVDPSTPRPQSWHDERIGVEAAMLFCLMLLLSPMSSKSHYVVLVLPILFYARAVVERPRGVFRWLLVPLVVLGPLTSKGLTGKLVGDLTLCWGFPTQFSLVLLVVMWALASSTRIEGPLVFRTM